jgi:hypothetical protein
MVWLVIELLPEGEGEMGACVYDGPSTVYPCGTAGNNVMR